MVNAHAMIMEPTDIETKNLNKLFYMTSKSNALILN